jgi:hypothetical protein
VERYDLSEEVECRVASVSVQAGSGHQQDDMFLDHLGTLGLLA